MPEMMHKILAHDEHLWTCWNGKSHYAEKICSVLSGPETGHIISYSSLYVTVLQMDFSTNVMKACNLSSSGENQHRFLSS